MLGRLGITGRLVLILLVLLVTLGLSGLGISWYLRGSPNGTGLRAPLPDRVAAIIGALETVQPQERALILRAVNNEDLTVTISAKKPQGMAIGRRLPVAEWFVGQYLDAMHDRDIEVTAEDATSQSWLGRIAPNARVPLRIVVPLVSGGFAIFETRVAPVQRIFGVPTGFWVGAFGSLLGLIALFAILRETRPLGELAHAVARFSGEGSLAPVQARGAPDVRKLIEAVNAMQARIVGLVKGRTILLGAVSHDLKTFITRLRLRIEDLPDEVQREKSIRDLDDMTALIDGAIAVARGTTGNGLKEPVDIGRLVKEEVAARHAADRIRLRIGPAAGAADRHAGGEAAIIVQGDQLGLKRVVGNLLDNALSYAGRCEVTVAAHGGNVTIQVDDDGPGIPALERAAVLEPFYRLEGSRNRATGGSGLGLAIVKQIVDGHGGEVEIGDSQLGGAKIRLSLPVSAARRPD